MLLNAHSSTLRAHISKTNRRRGLCSTSFVLCNYNALMRWVLWGLEVILVTVVVVGLCGSVRSEGHQALRIFAVFSLSCLTMCWSAFGDVHEASVDVLKRWKRKERLPLHARKFLRATRPIRAEIGRYFYVDRAMILTLLGVITESTFNALLATGV